MYRMQVAGITFLASILRAPASTQIVENGRGRIPARMTKAVPYFLMYAPHLASAFSVYFFISGILS